VAGPRSPSPPGDAGAGDRRDPTRVRVHATDPVVRAVCDVEVAVLVEGQALGVLEHGAGGVGVVSVGCGEPAGGTVPGHGLHVPVAVDAAHDVVDPVRDVEPARSRPGRGRPGAAPASRAPVAEHTEPTVLRVERDSWFGALGRGRARSREHHEGWPGPGARGAVQGSGAGDGCATASGSRRSRSGQVPLPGAARRAWRRTSAPPRRGRRRSRRHSEHARGCAEAAVRLRGSGGSRRGSARGAPRHPAGGS
jgi:hypothetical protein